MHSPKPTVSVITLSYNSGGFVIKALESIKSQTYKNIDHIIVDDCSTDNSVELIKNWIIDNNYYCSFIEHTENLGVTKTLNDAVKRISGKYWIGVSDDLIDKNALEKYVNFFESRDDEKLGLLYSDIHLINENDEIISHSYLSEKGFRLHDLPTGYCFKEYLQTQFMPSPGIFHKTEIFENVGYYDENLYGEDIDFYLRVLQKYKIDFFPQNLFYYRRHANSISISQKLPMHKNKLLVYKKFINKNNDIDKIIINNAKKYVINCYVYEDKVIATDWLRRISKNKLSLWRLLYYLSLPKIPGKFMMISLKIFKRLNPKIYED